MSHNIDISFSFPEPPLLFTLYHSATTSNALKLSCSQNVTCRAVFTNFSLCTFIFVNCSHTDGLFNEKRSSLARARAPAIRRLPAFSGCRLQAALGCGARYSASCIEVQYVVHAVQAAAAGVSAGRRMCGAPCLAAELYAVTVSISPPLQPTHMACYNISVVQHYTVYNVNYLNYYHAQARQRLHPVSKSLGTFIIIIII